MVYQIRVQGQVDPGWSEWFSGMELTLEQAENTRCVTSLTGTIADQAALRGLLNRLWDLNLTVLSFHQIDQPSRPSKG